MLEQVKYYEGAQALRSSIGNRSVIGQDTFISDSYIGKSVSLNRRNIIENAYIDSFTYTGAGTIIKEAQIGKFCSISWNVSISGNTHNYNQLSAHPFTHLLSFGFTDESTPLDKKRINIGNDVWIGANACILPGIAIGSGAIIGAGAVVTKSVPPYAIVAGNPARIIKFRFTQYLIQHLLQINWWDFPEEVIKENLSLFQQNLNEETIVEIEKIKKEIQTMKGYEDNKNGE